MKRFLALISIVLVCAFILPACTETVPEIQTVTVTEALTFVINQVEESQTLSLSWSSDKKLTKLEVTVTHGEQTVSQNSFEGDALANNEVVVDAYYGKHNVTVKATTESGVSTEVKKEVSLSASEYIIAPISGSMPQLYFTLNINEITKNGTIPAFVWLARPDSWNWDNLPENVYPMPTVAMEEILKRDNYDRMVEVADAYIEELYSINPASKFNLYINDYNSYLYMKLLPGNGIAEENYYVTLLSDGGASYKAFNQAFNSEDADFDADVKYSEMASNLELLYAEVRNTKDYFYDDSGFTVNTTEFNQYPYVAAKEKSNVEWWILRPRAGVLCSPDEEFINTVLTTDKTEGIIEERNFAAPLKAMSDEEKTALKSLYNFNNEMFEAAEEQGKKAMMILGSWANPENEPDFEDYVNLIKAYYGEEEFVYYYKGHPNTPTVNYPDKQAQLEALGLTDVESSINAELILFFYPDIYMCGYNSSTFLSVESPEMACSIFNMSVEDAKANDTMGEYRDLIGVYTSKLADTSDYSKLCPEAEHTYYLMEFHNDDTADIGIFDATTKTIKLYTASGSDYTEIK